MQPIAARQWSAGFLPSKFQGVKFNSIGDPVLYIENPPGLNADAQRDSIDAINALNRIEQQTRLTIRRSDARIAQYEMAFKMQTSVPGLMDMSKEPQRCSRCTARSRATARSRRTACWRGGWPSAACASSSSITATGIITAA